MTTDALMGRRSLLGFAASSLIIAGLPSPGMADIADPSGPIEHLDDALLNVMKTGSSTSFAQRYQSLAPVIEQVFNLNAVLAASIGLMWATLPDAQKASLAAAFQRYTVSSYVANFDSFNGQSFQVLPEARRVGNGEVVVQSHMLRIDKAPLRLDYVMRQGPAGWQAVDVLTDGSISRVAVQRSDFGALLASGGVPALTNGLTHKVANLTGGTTE